MNQLIATALFTLITCVALAQRAPKEMRKDTVISMPDTAIPYQWLKYLKDAQKYHERGEYLKAAQAYSSSFAISGKYVSAHDRYNAACSWALAGNIDSAFHNLFIVASNDNKAPADATLSSDILQLINDDDLKSLHNDKRWRVLASQFRANKDRIESGFNRPIVAMLDSIHYDDQRYRQQIGAITKKYGRNSKEEKEVFRMMQITDSMNLIKVRKILDKHGWLGRDVIGARRNSTLFLVIQHADIETQKKYLPMMREAVNNKKANANQLALLEDRIAIREGRKQIYGSQIGIDENGNKYVQPLDDPDNVDRRRASVGLNPLASYVSQWGIRWDPQEYKKQLPEIEKRERTKSKQ
jgi:hypothetical protein